MCETCVKRGKLIIDCSGSSQTALFNFELCHTQESGENMARSLQKEARLLCPPLSSRVCSNSCPLSLWCYLTISSSVSPLFFFLQPFPASGSFSMSWLFVSGGQSIEASAAVLPMNSQGWFPLGLTSLSSLQSKGLSRVFFNTTFQKDQFFGAQAFFVVQLTHP